MIQRLIWKYVLDTWTLRNQHLHCHANQLNLPDYHQAATALYEQCDQLPPAAQDALYQLTLAETLDLPAPCLEQWVVRGHKYFNQQVKAVKHHAQIQT